MLFAYQKPIQNNFEFAGPIYLIELTEVDKVEFKIDENADKYLRITYKGDIITIYDAEAIMSFRTMFNQYLYQRNAVQHFQPEVASK